MNRPGARLLSLAAATPDHLVRQDEAAERAVDAFGGKVFRSQDIRSLFENTGIRTRYAVRPMDWYVAPRPWAERNAVYLEEAERLWVQAARAALERAGVEPRAVGAVVTVSSTGIATPSLEVKAGQALGISPRALRTPVFGLGCGGGVTGLSIAARLAEARPGMTVLMVAVELCTLNVQPEGATKTNVVATALFGDGAAAVVLRADDGHGYRVGAVGEHTWPDTLDIMGWRIDPAGLGVVLDPKLPAFVAQRFREAASEVLEGAELTIPDIGRFVCHPGGAKVLPAIETSLGLAEGALDVERDVLAAYGNMSSPTVLFVLERVLAAPPLGGPLAMAALGPGFTATFAVLERTV